MANRALSEARVRELKPCRSAFDIRDAKLRGFGVRVLPSGAKRYFIHVQHRGERVWKLVGDANAMGSDEARLRAVSLLDAIRRESDAPSESLFEAVSGRVFERYAQVWKTRTCDVNQCYLRRHILPCFAGRQIADITRQDVERWFASLRATPVAADRSMPILSVILKEAENLGYRPEGYNSCRGIKQYRRQGRGRYLSDEEIGRLAARPLAHEDNRQLEVAAIRLPMLTGCRQTEICTLRWSDYREGHLFLHDSKVGPRTVWLSGSARNILDGLDRDGACVFRSRRPNRPRCRNWPLRF